MIRDSLIYTTRIHGRRLLTLYDSVEYYDAIFLLIQTIRKDQTIIGSDQNETNIVIGAYISCPLSQRRETKGYFGNGQCFVFRINSNCTDRRVQVYEWVGKLPHATEEQRSNVMFIRCDSEGIFIGGGKTKDHGPAIYLSADMSSVLSYSSDTFNNEPLLDKAVVQCGVRSVEAIGFVDC
ncbi:hypothetical protein ACOME3_009283 [Neoechinorhynchus agilis]